MTKKRLTKLASAAALSLSILSIFAPSASAQIKIAFIDPLSGGAASTGEAGLKTFQFMADQLNAAGGALGQKFEVIGYDNKVNPQESLVQAQKAIDAGIRIFLQGNGSAVAAALTDFVVKHNERNPDKQVMFLNYAAVDPVLTNEKCQYFHFRWDAAVDIKMEALTNFMKGRPAIKKVYLMNQDYSFGRSVRDEARKMLKVKRADIEIVGDELTALQKVTDFAPYIAKIKASGADSVITGNWAQDYALLLKAAADAGLQVDWYTYYAGGSGGPTATRQANLPGRVFHVNEGLANAPDKASREFETTFRAKIGAGLTYPRAVNLMRMLARAIEQAKSTEPKLIAAAFEGMEAEALTGGNSYMRKDDHQFFQPLFISSFGPLEGDMPFDEEKTGWGWKIIAKIDTPDTVLPTTCKMARP
jgi:branched-chain amino acid transport system substrate-binding protein